MKKITIAALLSTLVTAPALAADDGFYAGIGLGRANATLPAVAAIGASTKTSDTVLGALAGYQFSKYLGVEGQYTGAGKFTTANTSAKADTFALSAVGTMPLGDSFGLYGKLGYGSTKSSVSSTVIGVTGATRSAATYGLGLLYNATPGFGMRLGWDRYGAAITSAGAKQNYNSNVYSLAGVFKF